METTLGTIRRLHHIWTDSGQTGADPTLTDDLRAVIGEDGSVSVGDELNELSPPDQEFAAWAAENRKELES